ncbi:MAG: hypothetical protein ABJC79_05375 [Acidimicrobiia bacterium]
MDRRAIFFFGSAVVCVLMSLVVDADLEYVTYWLAAVYVVLGLLSTLDAVSRRSSWGRSGT